MINTNPGCIKSVVIIILRGHYSKFASKPFDVAVPLGKDDNKHTGNETEKSPPSRYPFSHGMDRMLVNKRDIIDHQQAQNDITEPNDRFQPVAQVINKFH
jgi:hypothetical protein